jgi:hypothetical protein
MSGTARPPSLRAGRRPFIPLAALLIVLAGCSPSSETSVGFLDAAGNHPPDIVAIHMDYARPDGSACRPCHGPDLHGGISGVSCFTANRNGQGCHADGPDFGEGPGPFHPVGWSDPATHGPPPKGVPAGTTGFSYCQICHGGSFDGGTSSVSCYTCHAVSAPHPQRPWTGGTFTHTNTNTGNAPVCAGCHLGGQNATIRPDPPAPFGTSPGCFNNTLCHGSFGPPETFHPPGEDEPAAHGPPAKDAPSDTSGFPHCQICHGSLFGGGASEVSCYTCHTVNAPHPKRPWTGGTFTHTNTDTGNAPVCRECHLGGQNATIRPDPPAPSGTPPGCFNNTLCHNGAGEPKPVPDRVIFLVIDEDSIDNGSPPNYFSAEDVNDQLADIGLRAPLKWFQDNLGETIDLYTGQVGDEGWFALKTIPVDWRSAGPTENGLRNYLLAGPGLGGPPGGDNREVLLDEIPDVTPLRATGLAMLTGQTVCALVYDSDIGVNYSPLLGNLQGANLGLIAFEVIEVRQRFDGSSSDLPRVRIEVRDTLICNSDLYLFANAPIPESSSEPFDIAPPATPGAPQLTQAP